MTTLTFKATRKVCTMNYAPSNVHITFCTFYSSLIYVLYLKTTVQAAFCTNNINILQKSKNQCENYGTSSQIIDVEKLALL